MPAAVADDSGFPHPAKAKAITIIFRVTEILEDFYTILSSPSVPHRGATWDLGEEHDQAFKDVKQAVKTVQVLGDGGS